MRLNLIPAKFNPIEEDFKSALVTFIDDYMTYNSIVDSDGQSNLVYLEMGYNNDKNYQSSFFFHPSDARQLANNILKAVDAAEASHKCLDEGSKYAFIIKAALILGVVEKFKIEAIRPYTLDPSDTMFGTVEIQLDFTAKLGDDKIELNLDMISDSIFTHENYFEYLYYDILLEKYKIDPEKVSINLEHINNIIIPNIQEKSDEFKSNLEKANTVEPIKPIEKQDTKELAEILTKKIKEEQTRMTKSDTKS